MAYTRILRGSTVTGSPWIRFERLRQTFMTTAISLLISRWETMYRRLKNCSWNGPMTRQARIIRRPVATAFWRWCWVCEDSYSAVVISAYVRRRPSSADSVIALWTCAGKKQFNQRRIILAVTSNADFFQERKNWGLRGVLSHQGFASILQCYLTKKALGKSVSAVCKYPQSLALRTGSPRARVCMFKKGKLLLRRPAL